MGNMMILPMMSYNLDNVPLFNGAYYIKNVEHTITPNNMVTTFTGTRQRSYSAPVPTDLTTYIKLDFNNYEAVAGGGSIDVVRLDIDPEIKAIIDGLDDFNLTKAGYTENVGVYWLGDQEDRWNSLKAEIVSSKIVSSVTNETQLVLTSAYRDEYNQSRVVYDNWNTAGGINGGLKYLIGLYSSNQGDYISRSIDAAFIGKDNPNIKTDEHKIFAGAKVLEYFKADGKYMSNHQTGDAIDLKYIDKAAGELKYFCSDKSNFCSKAVDESDHHHIKLKS